MFIAAEPVGHSVPFPRLGTGSINLLVFALLTVIAELKEKQSVIFAMEEPEIALPPEKQRRVSGFVGDDRLPHLAEIVWDPELSAAAAVVLASVLEWPRFCAPSPSAGPLQPPDPRNRG